MKVAYFLDVPIGLGGAGNLLLQQAALMSELYDVIIVIPEDEEGNYNIEYVRRCERHNMPYRCIQYYTAYRFSMVDFMGAIKSVCDIERFAQKENIELFHSVQLNIAVEYVSRKLRIPHLMDIYQLQEDEFKICSADIYPQYHLCDSELYSECWSRHLGVVSRCVRPVAPLSYIKRKNAYPKERLRILMLGGVCARKNQLAAIKAVEVCSSMGNKVELLIAGSLDDDYAEECRRYVEKEHLGQSVIFCGFISDIRPLLESCDCLLCASTDESFPSSIVEALTYDLTIISTPVAGVPEIFIDRENAFISTDFSAEGICKSILDSLTYYNAGRINGLHKNTEVTWKEYFERSLVRNQIDSYYKEIIINESYKSIRPFFDARRETLEIAALLEGIDDEGEKWIHQKYLYYAFIKRRLCHGYIYIWGAGKLGKLAVGILGRICPELKVIAFIDTYKRGFYLGKKVVGIEDIPIGTEQFYSISFGRGREAAISILKEKGVRLNERLWEIP